ncbi:tektin-like protein 1 [Amia ocellicauda]|uniref:tektin-like protein 1 n=1 Tax=Amia ocellicauda TaxID=2972642 RepID=UPI003464669C
MTRRRPMGVQSAAPRCRRDGCLGERERERERGREREREDRTGQDRTGQERDRRDRMPVQSIPLATVTIGPQSWQEDTLRSIRLAGHLVRRAAGRGPLSAGASGPRCASSPLRTGRSGNTEADRQVWEDSDGIVREQEGNPVSTVDMCSPLPRSALPPPYLRELCAGRSEAVVRGYLRGVRGVRAALQQLGARVAREVSSLGRRRGALDAALASLRGDLLLNHSCVERRSLRPPTAETVCDGVDSLLQRERRELKELKTQLEDMLRDTLTHLQVLGECSRRLQSCVTERSRVLDLIPHSGTPWRGCGRTPSPNHSPAPPTPSPTGPYTPECKEVMEISQAALSQSQQLRKRITELIGQAVSRQQAAHQSVNNGLVQKIAETVTLSQHLAVSSAATRQAINRKQRQLDWIQHSQDRSMGPLSRADLLTRERLDRPMVQLYHRHPGTQLPEATQLIQGGAVLRSSLLSSGRDLALLRLARLRLDDDLRGKRAAASVDSSVARLRRSHEDCRRGTPLLLQQGAC